MRVFLFDRSLPLTGGVARSFLHFAHYRDPTRIALHAVFCQRTDHDADDAFVAGGIVPHCIGDRFYAGPAVALRKLISRHAPDVILCCSFKPYILARIAALGRRTRVVFWHVAITDILDGSVRRQLYRWLARDADVVANSRATADSVAFTAHRGRTRVLYLGVPDQAAAPRDERQSRLGISPQAQIIAYTANFVAYKQHEILLDAFALLAPRYPALHLVFIGVGPRRDAMARVAESLPHDRVHFAGARDDVRALLGTIDIYAHPAVGEGFGIAVVEAMLAGLPIVAARAGALPELIDAGRTGLLCAPADPADLAACLRRLLDDPALCASLGSAARAEALARFAPEIYAASLTGILAQFATSAAAETS